MEQGNHELVSMAGPARCGIAPAAGQIVTLSPTPSAKESSVKADSRDSADEGPKKRSAWRVTLILIALFLSLFIAALDATIVSTAVPVMAHDLNSAAGYTWVGGAYLLTNCAAGPIWAKLSDIWGRRLMLLSSIAVFTAGSIVCAVAKTMPTLIAGRVVQGSAGGSMIMLVHICISDLFSVRQRSLIMGLTEGVWACAGGVGPILGGVFASLLSWRWCFWINLPFCGVAAALIFLFLDIKHEHTSFKNGIKAVDWFGITAFLGFTMMLLLGLDFGGAIFPWNSAKVVSLLAVGSVLIFVFIYGEARVAKYPMMPLGLFKNFSTAGSLLVTFFHALVFMNSEYYLPLFFQSVLNFTPLTSGLYLLPFVVSTALTGILCGIYIHRTTRFLEPIWLGTSLLALGTGLYLLWTNNPTSTTTTTTNPATIIGIQIIAGIGSGFLFEPPLIAIQSTVPQSQVATATSTFTFARNIGMSLSVVIGGAVFQNSMDRQSPRLLGAGIPADVVEGQLSGKNAAANVNIAEFLSLTDVNEVSAVREAFAWSIRNMYVMYTVLAVCGVLAGLLVKKSYLTSEHVETVTGIREDQE